MDEWDSDPLWDDDDINDFEAEEENMNSMKTDTKTAEEAIDLLREFCLAPPQGISWGVVIQDGDAFALHTRVNQPCYGEMRKYGKGSTRPEDYKPGDLHDPFPAGTPIAIGAPFYQYDSLTAYRKEQYAEDRERLFDYVFSAPSPWRHITGKAERLISSSRTAGCVITDTNVDPTAMVQFFMTVKNVLRNAAPQFAGLVEMGVPELDALLTAVTVSTGGMYGQPVTAQLKSTDSYTLSTALDIRRFANGDIDTSLSNSKTFRDGEDYNRPKLHHVFGNSGSFLPKLRGIIPGVIQKYSKVEDQLRAVADTVTEARLAALA